MLGGLIIILAIIWFVRRMGRGFGGGFFGGGLFGPGMWGRRRPPMGGPRMDDRMHGGPGGRGMGGPGMGDGPGGRGHGGPGGPGGRRF